MANQGAKKRKEENTCQMAMLLLLIIACLVLTSVAYVMPYQRLSAMAKPTYADDGNLLDGGFDMSTGGICGYLHDIIYITSFVQVMSIISGKFWYTFLVGVVEDGKTRRKREKMEKKASRTKFMKSRNR